MDSQSGRLLPLLFSISIFLGCMTSASAQEKPSPEQLIKRLSDADPLVRGESLRALEALSTDVVVPKVLEALQAADKDVATRLVKVLVEHPAPSEIAPLIALAEKYDGLGSDVFAVLGPEGTHALLAAAVKNCQASIGGKSFLNWAGETASLGGEPARAILLQEVRAENPCTRQAALWGVAMPSPGTTKTAEEARSVTEIVAGRLGDTDPDVARTAELLLTPSEGDTSEPMEEFSLEALVKFFQAQTQRSLRAKTLKILAHYGDTSVQDLMTGLAASADPEIKKIAASYAPPQVEEDRVEYSESPQSGITPPEKAAEIERRSESKNSVERVSAAAQMGSSNDADFTAGLVKLTKDTSPSVRAAAAKALGVLNGYFEDAAIRWAGNREESAPALFALFDDPSPRVRATAIDAYVNLFPEHPDAEDGTGDHMKILSKLASLACDANPKVAHAGVLAYTKFLWPEDLQRGIELLKNPNPEIRRAVAGAIAHSNAPEAVKPLEALLKDPDVGVRSDAARDLWYMVIVDQHGEKDALAARLETPPLTEVLKDPLIYKDQILDLLAASHDPAATKIISDTLTTYHMSSMENILRLMDREKNPNKTAFLLTVVTTGVSASNWNALTALLNTHDPAVADPLLAYAKTPDGAWVDQERVMLELHDSRIIPLLLSRLKDEHEYVRVRVAGELAGFQDARIVPALIPALKDEAWAVQYAVAGALGKLGDKRAVPALSDMLAYNPGAAAQALGELKASETIPKLTRLLADPHTKNREEIAAGIAKMPGAQAGAALGAFIANDQTIDCNLKTQLTRTLAAIQDPSVIPALQKINLDGWGGKGCVPARLAAAQALAARGTRALPEDTQNAAVP